MGESKTVRSAYVAVCVNCGAHVADPMETLPRASWLRKPDGELVMRTIIAEGCGVCGQIEVEIRGATARPTLGG